MEKSLKVLAVSTSDIYGGAARAAFRIHQGVRLLNIDSRMLVKNKYSTNNDVYDLDDFVNKNSFFKILTYIQNKLKNKIQHYNWKKYPDRENVFLSDLRSISLNGALQKIEFDLLHLHWINLRFLNLNELRRINKPIIWTLHDSWAFTGVCHYTYDCDNYLQECGNCPFLHSDKKTDLSRKIWMQKKKIYKHLNLHIVTPSQWLADCVAKSSLLKGFPVTVIPNCLDVEIYSPGDKHIACINLGLDSSKKIILFGAVNPTDDKNKGFKKLLEVIQYLENCNKENITIAVFGKEKPIENTFSKIPIHYLGYLNTDVSIVQAYRAADVMVVPSLSEVFGQTASEAMACGTPVVAFNCTGIKEVVEHKKTGYLAEPFNTMDFATGIIWCLEHNVDRVLSKAARMKVETKFGIDKIIPKYIEIYEKLIY